MKHQKTRQRSANNRTVHENIALRRENSKLRKQLQRLNGAINSMTYNGFTIGEIEEEVERQEEQLKTEKCCPNCGSETGEVALGRFTYDFCSKCDWRERHK